MKKYILLFVLMLIVSFGFFYPKAHALTPTAGSCSSPAFLDQESCESSGDIWTTGFTSTPIITPTSTSTSTSTTPSVASQTTCTGNGLGKIICQIQQILNSIIPVLMALGIVYFIWGIVRFMIADGEEAKTKGKDQIIYGLIGFAVIVGLWGLINLVVKTFNLSTAAPTGININGTSSVCSLVSTNTTLQNFLGYVTCILNSYAIPLIFSLAVVFFIWGVVQSFIINADEESKREQGKQFMIWGIVAIAVMLCVWGLVAILGNTFIPGFNGSILPHVVPPPN